MLPLGVVMAMAVGAWSDAIPVTGTIDGKTGSGTMRVYLPAGCSSERRCPLVLALHGWGDSAEGWMAKGDLAAFADQYGLVIAVPSMGKTIYETRFYPESRGKWTTAPGARWVGEVILPYLRAHFPVWPDRAHTAVFGYSTGGRGAVLLAEAYPQFAFAGSVSGTYDLLTLQPAEGEYQIHEAVYGSRAAFQPRWELDNVVAPDRLAKLGDTRLFISHGAKDAVVKPDQLESLRRALKATAVQAELVTVPGAGHDWKFWTSQWPRLFELAAQSLGALPALEPARRLPPCPAPGAIDAQGVCRPVPCGGIPGGCGEKPPRPQPGEGGSR
ncbi:MAG: Dipeptidyl aminopeptidase/acylaminoacyl-peptidase-like protein [Myxococcaceae bacterium]|nr:Dipeptidyl aminopeptidase/acylaminoacyl-peptidase-like protein [Myxococcaceae bacterium]